MRKPVCPAAEKERAGSWRFFDTRMIEKTPDSGLPAVRTEALVCGYDNRKVLDAGGLTLKPGSCTAVLGPNGAGKTTLLRTLAGMIRPLKGSVFLDGTDVSRMDPEDRARKIAVLPQEGKIDPNLTVHDLVCLGRTPYLGMWGRMRARDTETVNETISECGLDALSDRRLGEISGGERQRSRLAMVIAQQTPVVLLDEPTAHLDIRRRYELFRLLEKFRDEYGWALIVVLHDMAGLRGLADSIMVVSNGSVQRIPADQTDSLTTVLCTAFEVPPSWIRIMEDGNNLEEE